MSDNVTYVVSELLKDLGVKVSHDYIYERLKSNPFYPSIRSVSDFLKELSVDHRVVKLSHIDLINAGMPFIAHSGERGGYFYYLKSIDNEEVIFSDNRKGSARMTADGFFSIWSGVALFAAGKDKTNDISLLRNYRKEKLNNYLLRGVLLVMVLLLIVRIATEIEGLSIIQQFNIPTGFAFYFTKLTGLVFSLLLVMHEMKIPSSIINRLCHVSKNADCSSVTGSELATLYGGITLADIGFTYFGGGVLAMILSPLISLIPVIQILSVAILPTPVILILYQIIKIRKWCPLCMGVQAVVISEGLISLFALREFSLRFEGIIVFSASMLMVNLTLYYYKNSFRHKNKYLTERITALKYKRDPAIIDSMLKREMRIEIPYSRYNLLFGDSESPVQLTAFLSLHCSGCVRLFRQIRDIFSSRKGVSVHIIFSTPPEGKETMLSIKIWTAYSSGDMAGALQYLDEWFKYRKSEINNLVPEEAEAEEFDYATNEILSYNNKLFEIYDIKLVPALFINGHRLPEGLNLEETEYYLDYLEDKTSSLEIPMQRKEVALR